MAQLRYTRNLFLRGICIIYLFAFLSFYIQIPGLYGDNGILPARTQLDLKTRATFLNKMKQKPTFLWFAPYLGLNVDYMLDVLSLLGAILSFAGFVSQKFCIAPVFAGLWSLYYSLYQIGQTFMLFQWDVLLLEVGFLCIFVAPLWYAYRGNPSDYVTFWAVRWLLFRLMFSSGVVKFTAGCPVWWKLDALNIHFESQCIPTALAWYAHHLPTWLLRLSTVVINVIELAIPLLFFFPNRKVRIIAFYLQVFLQICIIATGNYNFFNFLTICLCISLLDDQFFYKRKSKNNKSRIRNYLSTLITILVYGGVMYETYIYYGLKIIDNWTIESNITFTQEEFGYILYHVVIFSIYIGLISFALTLVPMIISIFYTKEMHKLTDKLTAMLLALVYVLSIACIFAISIVPYSSLSKTFNSTMIDHLIPLTRLHSKVDHLHITNRYGLFSRMTGVDGRPEIVIEGSDSIEGPWKEYEFLYKPGNVNNSLPFVAPHQPRLDWQMWFAALGTYQQNPWLMSLAYRLLTGQPEVLALMNTVENPFRDRPPKYVRASLYHYHYTSWSQTSNTRAWWTRERIGEYFPTFSQNHSPLIEFLTKTMKILQEKPGFKVTNEPLKLILDNLRSLVSKVEPSLILWGVFTAGCAIIVTGYSNSVSKKK
ncbi:Lipase maturation factor 2 [Trachymyrmex septentrionalis]|uniref:Lipase maturation factor n=1 Tax=Trachymyrmex septentrionalis TaxID=34720 RepID=A0A195FSY6_9HYME|nr:PREDICTED: lipase maturation factor 2-like [Trachymyrmex septentrionalis]KYN43556.1 Lipase maturation factor 2 [Trachymyrmex septentrionalis]